MANRNSLSIAPKIIQVTNDRHGATPL